MEYTKKQFPYNSIVHLNQNSIQELIWWANNLEISHGESILSPINKTIIQTDVYQKVGGILLENINRKSMDSSRVKVTHQSGRTQTYKSGPINFS